MNDSLAQVPASIIEVDEQGSVNLVHAGRSREAIRSAINDLGRQMQALPEAERLDMRVDHEFMDGIYIRRLHIPAGTVVVGKVHRKDCLNVVESGDISILTEFGSRRVKSGFTGVSPAGIQKLGFAHEDTVFLNVFRTDCTDPSLVERELAIEPDSLLLIETER